MDTRLTRGQALEALRMYNKEPFHILHALTVEGAMRWFARDQGFGDDEEFLPCVPVRSPFMSRWIICYNRS